MECTRCGGTVTTYRLSGHTAFVCGSCGRVGIEADHRGEASTRETWDEAIQRFYRRETTDRTADTADVERAATALAEGVGDAAGTDLDDAVSNRAEGTETDGQSSGSVDGDDADDQDAGGDDP